MKMNKLIILLFLTSCCRVSDKIKPKISYHVPPSYIQNLQTPFSPLKNPKEPWAREYLIAKSFAKDFDLYRAISSFKRAKVLIPKDQIDRINEITYDIILCYFLGKKYDYVIKTFENSSLENIDKSFPAFSDLLVILYQSYEEIGNTQKKEEIKEVLNNSYSKLSSKLQASLNILNADVESLKSSSFFQNYETKKKSVSNAQLLNALIPGSGYLYLGQKRAFLTSLLLNSTFIAASFEFFRRGYLAAGIITTSFEIGWYFGGIYGAGEQAKFYNERVYEEHANITLKEEKLYPFFMIQHSF